MTKRPRPRIVLLTGAPGSGKTTLGTRLSRALGLPFLARDDVRRALYLSAGSWGGSPGPPPTPEASVETFLAIVETMTSLGVSCIAEYVVREDDHQLLGRIVAAGDCVVLVTHCEHAADRQAARHRNDPLLNRPGVLDALGFASLEDHGVEAIKRARVVAARMRTDFPVPVLHVSTDDDYAPDFETIVEFAVSAG